ncbi:MAG: aminotransferase class I/II-fold pyridoxal phosphate-dependent enzyme [Candidatus Omnitrophica bacterium]|nr:aminotransferase class I/II-fold pyridoxal phosphate-dependent enzyme [Candidatus Omnitrophota bacterium]
MSEVETLQKTRVSSRVAALKPSGIRKFFELVMGRPEVISLGVGEPDYSTPWSIREEAIFSLERGRTSYTSNQGMIEFRQIIARWVEENLHATYDPKSEILVTVGVSEALDLACRAILEPGDEILIPEPCFVSYPALVELAGGKPVMVPTSGDNDFFPTIRALEDHTTERTKAILLNSPNNPTGAVIPRVLAEEVAAWVHHRDLIMISDEIYSPLVYEGEHVSFASLEGMKERTILLHGLSKGWAMTGWRIGYSCAPSDITAAMTKIHQYQIMCASIMGQSAGIEALKNGRKEVEKMREDYSRRRRIIAQGFNDIGLPCHVPKGAFYAFPSIQSTGLTSEEFAFRLLEEQDVALVPGSAFGDSGEGYMRCCYAVSLKTIEEALRRIEKFVKSL